MGIWRVTLLMLAIAAVRKSKEKSIESDPFDDLTPLML